MSIERMIRLLAGTLVLTSLLLSQLLGAWWLLLAAFVGTNLVQSSFTRFCPAEWILQRLGAGSGRCTLTAPVNAETSQ